MKKLFTIIAVVMSFMSCFAQHELTISTGLAFPAGDFAKTSGGAAKMGIMGDIVYQYQLQDQSKLRVAGMVKFQSYKVDIAEFERAFPDMHISSTNWTALTFLVGPVVKFELSETSFFEPRFLLGYMSAKSPKVTASSGSLSAVANSDYAGAFATMLGAAFKFGASDNMMITACLDYLTANPRFSITASSGGMSDTEEASQQISSFSVTIGLTFKID